VARAPEIVGRFREIYPASGDPHVWRAPGRVNLIGEHTDYNLGFVLPMAIGLECQIAAARADGVFRVYSEQLAQGAQWHIGEILNATPRGDWTDRVVGIAWALSQRGVSIEPQNILISSSVPLGAGLSSSAALGVALTLALGGPRPPLGLAQVARLAETAFAGVPCGIMDQFASAHGGATLLDCRSLEFRDVALPREIAVVAVNSMVKHELGDSAYRRRVEECAAAARAMGVASLRDGTLDQVNRLDGVLLKRSRHVITENARVEAFAAAAAVGDLELIGRLVTESHRSLRDDYEVSCPELDFLVETALGIPGVLGARLTGGGFGGCTVNLVRRELLEQFHNTITERYASRWGLAPELHVCEPSPGASQIF
jgi:galactokinase